MQITSGIFDSLIFLLHIPVLISLLTFLVRSCKKSNVPLGQLMDESGIETISHLSVNLPSMKKNWHTAWKFDGITRYVYMHLV